jgi:phage FluMu protein gp41
MPRRRTAIFALLAVASAAFVFAPTGPAVGQTLPEDRTRGIVLDGLKKSPEDGVCRGNFELTRSGAAAGLSRTPCTHGPDPAPPGVDVRNRRGPVPRQAGEAATAGGETAAASGSIPCYGTGSDGYRVHVIYARASNVADRYAQYASSLVQWTAAVDGVVSASAAETGGTRHVRFLTDASCNLKIDRVTLSATGDDNLDNTVSELHSMGYNRTDRKYLVYTDANIYCGIGQIYLDDTADPTPGVNANNGHLGVPGTVARVDNGCWGLADSAEAHELMHNLGGVQESAPHATNKLHCTDESDRMCYADGSGATLTYPCATSHENRFDCNHDDYFSTSPPVSSYLATHWNTASSAFLAKTDPAPSPVPSPREDVVWTAGVGVGIAGNDLTKTAPAGWGNAGAVSRQALGSGDGFVELTASEASTYRMIGLSNGDSGQSYVDIDFAMYLAGSGIHVYEQGVYRSGLGSYVSGDVLSVEVEGGTVTYRRNGTVLYRSAAKPVYPLLIDTALDSSNGTLRDVFVSANFDPAPRQDVVWTAGAGVGVDGNDLTKTAPTGWGNAGAVSRQTIRSGDGFVELTASETSTSRMIGLSNGDSGQNYLDIDFAMYLAGSGIHVYEQGVYRSALGSYVSGDVLSVEVAAGKVTYGKNGAVLYRSTTQAVYPLLVDTALYSQNATLRDVVVSGDLTSG